MTIATTKSRFRSWPITEAVSLEPALKEMGLKVPAAEIDGTSTTNACLSDALVSVGPAGRGGTGSFISSTGLIITNHHVALDAVRRASTAGKDLLADGFVARSMADEVADPDYEVWITRSCVDVSEKLADVRKETDPLKRANLVRDRRQELARDAEAAATGRASSSVRCEVQEMWPDRTYVLFTYERLRDVRLVYVPPMSLGCFGGDTECAARTLESSSMRRLARSTPRLRPAEYPPRRPLTRLSRAPCPLPPGNSNFEWPRHTADFTLLRAYVAPDAPYRWLCPPPSQWSIPSAWSTGTWRPTAPRPSTRPTTCRTRPRSSCARRRRAWRRAASCVESEAHLAD